jgi:L-alanine-DL-glutamate epimerase-like enolase superfamily enzyme
VESAREARAQPDPSKPVKLEIEQRTLSFARPLRTAYGELAERKLLIVSLSGEDGSIGYGEAAPLEPYDGVSFERTKQALERYVPVLASEASDGARLIDTCRRVDDLPAALAAIDMALWDRGGRMRGKPIASLITDTPATSVAVNATLSAIDRAGVAEEAATAVAGGFGCVKLKVGIGDDAGRVAAVRAAVGPDVLLRLDANGAWGVEQAVRTIEALAPAGLELVEEPVHGLRDTRAVRERVAVRVAIDETAAEHGALGAGVADAVCLKISRCGGIGGLLAAATLVRASGAEVYVSSTFDGPLGIAAAVHAAAALASRGSVPHCGLATLALFSDVGDVLAVRDGSIQTPSAPGLGLDMA